MDLVPAAPLPRIPVQDRAGAVRGEFPVRRIHCVGRNFAEHAREMGALAPASRAERGTPTLFMKPADAVVCDGRVPYPPATRELHHEVELVVALGRDAPAGIVAIEDAAALIFGYGVGLDLTRRDQQAAAKAKGLPWDTAKGFDHSAPVGALLPAQTAGDLAAAEISLTVNDALRQHATLDRMLWSVPEILHELSKLYALRAGDLVFMGTPAGVGALLPGDRFVARIDGLPELRGRIDPPARRDDASP